VTELAVPILVSALAAVEVTASSSAQIQSRPNVLVMMIRIALSLNIFTEEIVPALGEESDG
jgi:hypothetical protein